MNLQVLFQGIASGLPAVDVADITTDSRTARPGGLFLAVRGAGGHGLDFLPGALQAGVAAVVWEPAGRTSAPVLPAGVVGLPVTDLGRQVGTLADRFFGAPSAALAVTGITGTNGKTTTAWLTVQALTALGRPAGYMGTLGWGPGTAVESDRLTTPDCVTVHRRLRSLVNSGSRCVVTEVSSHALDQGRVDGVRFKVAAFTNLSRDHLDYHGTLADYGAAKARLFTGLQPATAVLNLDDGFGRELAGRLTSPTRLLGVTLGPGADDTATLTGSLLTRTAAGLHLEVREGRLSAELHSPLWGRFNASNLLVALGILRAHDIPLEAAAGALAAAAAPPGRMERVPGRPDQPVVLVDYAHTPDALQQALTAVRDHCAGEVWCVFGCGGNRDQGKRAAMGEVAAALAAHVVLTDDNPRDEDPGRIIADILAGIPDPARVRVVPDRAAAIAVAIRSARAGDAVLIAGKGHEQVQVSSGGVVRPFSDQATARTVLGTA